MVICPFAPYGLAHGRKTCQICHKLGPDFADRIPLKPLDGFVPFEVLWELCRPVIVQHQGHLTLTLDLKDQILKMLFLRNGRADWHGTKGIWVDMMLDPHCDFELWPYPWPWPFGGPLPRHPLIPYDQPLYAHYPSRLWLPVTSCPTSPWLPLVIPMSGCPTPPGLLTTSHRASYPTCIWQPNLVFPWHLMPVVVRATMSAPPSQSHQPPLTPKLQIPQTWTTRPNRMLILSLYNPDRSASPLIPQDQLMTRYPP